MSCKKEILNWFSIHFPPRYSQRKTLELTVSVMIISVANMENQMSLRVNFIESD